MIENVNADIQDTASQREPFLTEDIKQQSFTGGNPYIFAMEITPEHYLHWQKYSKDPYLFRSAFCIENGANVSIVDIITEYAMHGLRVYMIEMFQVGTDEFAGIANIRISGPQSILDYLWHKYKYTPDDGAHGKAVELKESWLTA